MKIYKYWVVEKASIDVNGVRTEITLYGGSNRSREDASALARQKAALVGRKIAGDKTAFETYETEIREEVLQVVDDTAVITRNRYGAKVLNVQNQMIMDIDEPRRSFWDIFKKQSDNKTAIMEMIRKLAQKPAYSGLGFRIYETPKGMRVIVMGKNFDPADPATIGMMREFNCDSLYTMLCQRQGCFRARLTPKPGRIKVRGFRVRLIRDSQQELAFQQWLANYEAASRNYGACKFLEQIGPGMVTPAVRLHDEVSGALKNLVLA